MTAADHANTVREAILGNTGNIGNQGNAALDALDKLEAQAEEGRNWKASCARYLAARQAAEADAKNWSQRYFTARGQKEAAEAERDRLADALRQTVEFLEGSITFDAEWEAEAKRLVVTAHAALAQTEHTP